MGRLRLVAALAAISTFGFGCGPEVTVPEPSIPVYTGTPDTAGLAFADTTAPIPESSGTTPAPSTTEPSTTEPTGLNLGLNLALDLTLDPAIDLGLDVDLDAGPNGPGTTAPPFALDLSLITSPSTSLVEREPITPTSDSDFCAAAAAAHSLISSPGAGLVTMSDYATALEAVVPLAPAEVSGYYTGLAAFTRRSDSEGSYPGAANDAARIFAAQVAANAFIEATCGFSIL